MSDVKHLMIPGSHERPGGGECACGAAWSLWENRCTTQRPEGSVDPTVAALLGIDGLDENTIDMLVDIGQGILDSENAAMGLDPRLSGHLSALPAREVTLIRDQVKVAIEAEKKEAERRKRALQRVFTAVQGALGEGRG